MLFFYGWRTKRLSLVAVDGHSCSYCAVPDALYIETCASYIHFFWIPFIPLGKKVFSYCGHCKQSLKKREMPPDLLAKATQIGQQVSRPWYHFILVGLFAAGFGLFFILILISVITHI